MRIFQRNISRLRIVLFTFEFLLILGITYGIAFLTFLYQNGTGAYGLFKGNALLFKTLLVVVVCQTCMYLNELYDYKVTQGRREFTIRLLQSLGIACILLSFLYLFLERVSIGQTNFLLALPAIVLLVFGWRELYPGIMHSHRFAERVAILGSSNTARRILEEIRDVKDSGFDVVTLFTEDDPDELVGLDALPVRKLVPLREFPLRGKSLPVDRIVVAIGDRRGKLPFETLLDCRFDGVLVEEAASFYEKLTGKILLDDIRPSWFIFSEGFRKSKFTLKVKRATDIVLSVTLLALSAPFLLVVALLTKLDSSGPVIYKQDRVGQGGKDYTLYKFRSMVEHAEAMGAEWAKENDPRVTRVGRFIRKYRIDEVPQLINVFKGDMSLVGPRPERREFVMELARQIPYYPQRLFVKPGVTGWAQIKYHYGASRDDTKEKLQYDLYYIKHMSFLFDLSIVFDTIRVVLTGKGAR
ncbi:MAG: TIGR03013 family XrtA/PEP-CTERM system glycosyltransferase [bacterium]